MSENPKSAVDFLLNGNTPTAKEPSSSSVDFLLEQSRPQNKQEFNKKLDERPVYLESDPRYTLDPNKYETKFQSEFQDKVNSFWQGIDETQKSANDYDISAAKLKIANNNKILQTLNQNDPVVNELLRDNEKQFKFMESATEDKIANEKEIDDEYVSKKYKLNQALVQGQGSDAGFFDKMAYTMPNMIGSSMSLVVPNLLTTFGTKAGATLATAALAKAGMKGGRAGWVGSAIALVGALGGIAAGRHLESKSEVGGQITANEDALSQEYINKVYNETGQEITKEQIPQDAMDNIIIQANQGREELYWKNMALAIPDMGEALLFSPKLNLFGSNKVSKAIDKAIDYNKYTRLGTKAAKFGAVYESEKFEEGAQYAFGKRQEDFALNSGEYENQGFIKNLLTDSKDVLSSMNFSPIGEIRGSGRYAEDKQFQTAEESGGMLAAIMGGVQTVGSISKDLNTYRKVNKELQDSGVFNVDDKYFRLKDEILQKHFENDTTHHLLEGVKNLIGKKNEQGTEILTKEDAKEELNNIQKAFDTYQNVTSQVNEIEKKGAFLMFDSAQQKEAKKAVKNNLFHTSLQLVREQKELGELSIKRESIQNTINNPVLKKYNNINDLIEKQTDLLNKLKSFNPIGLKESYNIPFKIKANEEKLKQLEEIKKAEEDKLKEAGIDFKIEPLTIAEQELNKQIIAKESLLQEQTENYKELLTIKNDKTLQDWYSKYLSKQTKNSEAIAAQQAKEAHTKETTETPVDDFSEFENDEENAPKDTEDTRWYKDITDRKELDNILQEGRFSGKLTQEEEDVIVGDWENIQKEKAKAAKVAAKTDWGSIINTAVSGDELDKIIDQIDAEGTVLTDHLLTVINKKRESLGQEALESNAVTEKLANGVTNAIDDNLNTDEVLESNNTSNETSNKEFVSKKPNALMMKFYEFVSGAKKWARNTSGELKGYVSDASKSKVFIGESDIEVSQEVNNPSVATEGSEVAYIHNGKDIALVDSTGRIVGFLGLGTNVPGLKASLDVIEAHKELLAIRTYVLGQPSGTIKTTILAKGHGKLLTKMVDNLPILDEPISNRPEDMIEGRPLFLYDDGTGLTSKNLTGEQAKVAEQFKKISFTNEEGVGEGRVYQVVKTSNGTWFVIPIYTKLINETANASKTINTIISILKGAIVDGKTIDYNKALQQLNKYIFATNTNNYKNNFQTLRIKEDKDHVNDGTITVAGFTLTFNDVLTGNNITEFKNALGKVRHNISINELGTAEEDSRLINDNILATNAYTDSTGQYYVQPYIEVNNPEGYVKPKIKAEPISATTATNISTSTITDLEAKKVDIERRRQEAYRAIDVMADLTFAKLQSKLTGLKSSYALTPGKRLLDEINDLEIVIEKRGKELAVDIDAKYDAELKALEGTTTTTTDKQELDRLRIEEQKEYAAMPNPNDAVARKKIYDKYDAVITPVLDRIKADIERRRKEDLAVISDKDYLTKTDKVLEGLEDGKTVVFKYNSKYTLGGDLIIKEITNVSSAINIMSGKEIRDAVNNKYDAELEALKVKPVEEKGVEIKPTVNKIDFQDLNNSIPVIKGENITSQKGLDAYIARLKEAIAELAKDKSYATFLKEKQDILDAINNYLNKQSTTKQEIIPPVKPRHNIDDIDVNDAGFSRTELGGEAVNKASLDALNKILPGLTVANAKLAEEVGKNMKDTYGMFHNMLIYLFKGATNRTLFHEAFHGVFRNILSDEERRAVLNEAIKKYDKPNAARLQFLREGKGNANLSDEILTQLHYEERLADDFGKHADGVFNPSLGQRIINFFKKIVDLFNIFKNANNDQINDLFEAVTKGKFAKRSIDAKLANKAIDLNDFGGAYKRVLNTDNLNIPISVELERTNSIANQVLDGIAKELAKGVPMSEININTIGNKIKAQYKLVWETEDAKSDEELNGPLLKIAYAVDLKFGEMFENVKKQIALTRKLNFKGEFVETTEIEGSEDTTTDSENIIDMQGNESKGFQEQTVISGIRSATQDIKLFLSNIPVINKDGVVQVDNYGFTIFHSYEKLYYKLETSLVGTTSFVEQLKIMRELAPYSTEIQQIIDAIENITDPQVAKNFKQQFAANFNKAVLNYKLVTYTKSKLGYVFKMLNPNRKDVALNLKTQWTSTNITDPTNLATNDIRTFNEDQAIYEVSKNKVSALLNSYWAKGEQGKGTKILTPKLTIDEVYELAQKLGIGLSFDSIELYASLKESNLIDLTNDLLVYGKLMYVDNKFSPARSKLTSLIKLEINSQTELFTSSFNNVENSVVYAVQHQSFASKLVKALNSNEASSSNLVTALQRDPMNLNNIILRNKNKLEMFALDGLKMQGDNITGKKFNQIHEDDYLAMIINMYDNPTDEKNLTKEEVAVYAPIIPAEKGLSFGFTGVKISVNKIDNKIPADSQIVNEFKQLFFNELARIRQVMIDIKTLPENELVNNYHLGKKLGLQFNLPNAITPKLKAELDALLQKTLDEKLAKDINTSKYLEGLLSNEFNKKLMDRVTESIVANLEDIEQTHVELALQSDVIQMKDGQLVSDKLSTNNVEKLIREWALNSTLFNISQSLLINGDPAFYKGAEDNGKRFYQGFSMLKYADTTTIDDSYKYLKGGKMKINVIADVKESTKSTQDLADIARDNNLPKVQELADDHYNQKEQNGKVVNPLNATDAQLFISVGAYAELKRLFGISSQELTEGFTNADLADALNTSKSQQGILDIIKPFFYGVQWNEEYQRYVPIQVKCSIFPLSNQYVANNPLLAEHKALMDADENYPQVIAFESSMKALLPNRANIENIGETSIVELDLNNFGEQVANPDHMLDSSNSSLRQMKMLMYGMVQDELMYGDKTGRQIKDEIAMLDKANIEESLGKVVSAFEGNNKEFNEFIQSAITSRNSTSIIEAVFEQKPDGTFAYPLDLINSKATIQLISSIFTKRVVRQEFKGGAAVQVSSVGLQIGPKASDYKNAKAFQAAVDASPVLSKLQTSLNWVRKGDIDLATGKVSSIDFIEAYAPAHAREFINPDGSFKDNIPDELKQMLIYRIPYEGAHSSMVIRIVGFLPIEYKGAMLLPYEVTQQFGADFDFDKIYFIVKDFVMSKDGKFKIFKYIDGTSQQNVADRYKALINHILKNDKNARDLVKEANKEIKEFDYTLDYNDKIQVLLDNNIIPFPEDFAKLSVADQNIKPARDNKILDNYMQILRSVNMLESLITPSGPGSIADVYENVEESEDHGNYFTPGHQVYLKGLFHKISMLKGVSALQVTGHAWATEGNLEIKPITEVVNGETVVIERGVKVFGKDKDGKSETQLKKNLSQVISDSGNKIVEELSSMMAVILDAVKSPNQLPSIGISMKTLPVWAYLVRLGFGSKVASQFTSQQAMKDLSAALENNDKQLKSKDFVKQDVNTIRTEYVQKYQKAYDELYAEHKPMEGTSINSRKIVEYLEKIDSEKVGNYNTLSLDSLEKYTTLNPEELAKKKLKQPYKSLSQQNEELTGIEKLKYLQLQIITLNIFKNSENIIQELGELNNLFSINKETGPNFEDVNGKKASKESLISKDTAIKGIGELLNSDAIKPYIDTIDAQFEIMAKHYNFASPLFNNIKTFLAKIQYGDNANLTRIPAEDREVINGFVQMFLDSEETFDDIYIDENRIPEEDFINDLKVLLSKKTSTAYKYKIFDNKVLTAKDQEKLKATTLLQSLEVVSIKNSDQNYIALKGNRYELAQKEMMIDEISRLYNSKFKQLAIRLIQQSFKDTGFFSGLHSYSGLIHPSILQSMGLTEGRENIRKMAQAESTNVKTMERIVDQLVRNFAKKFTRVYDNNQKVFTEIDGGKTLIVDMNSKDSRLKELIRVGQKNENPMYIRYTLNDDYTPIYRLDKEVSEESGQITYRQVTYLGSISKKLETNFNSDEVETKFPNNKYEKFVSKDKSTSATTGGMSKADLAAEFGEDELIPVEETPEVETESDSENITDGQSEIKPEGTALSLKDLADEWGDEEMEEESTETKIPVSTKLETKINFQEEPTTGYRQRTINNAKADATIAIAVDFNSAGEKLTKTSVLGQNKKYISIDANTLTVSKERVDKIVEMLNSVNAKTLNIAGNGIYTMKGKYTQEQIDKFTYDLLKAVIESPNLKTKIESVRSGGQTGFDEAGAKAGIKLGLPTIVLAPKGWTFRNINGQDISNEQQFKNRFNENISPNQEKSVPSTIINPEITQNKPDGLPGIDRSPESCS